MRRISLMLLMLVVVGVGCTNGDPTPMGEVVTPVGLLPEVGHGPLPTPTAMPPLPAPSLVPTSTPTPTPTQMPATVAGPTLTLTAVASPTATPSLIPTPTVAVMLTPTDTFEPVVTVCSEFNDGEKRIIVDLSDQKLYACEDERLVLETPISTGRAVTPTPEGEYRIYLKLVADRMTGPGYNLPAVPWTMYFYRGYAVHGAYWHNKFGQVMSHGCINLPTMECPAGWSCPAQEFADGRDVAKELFYWADPVLPEGANYDYASEDNPGTLVIVRP